MHCSEERELSHSLFPLPLPHPQTQAWAQNSLLFSEMTHSLECALFCFWLWNELTHHTRQRQRQKHRHTNANRQSVAAAGETWRSGAGRRNGLKSEINISVARCSLSIACRFNAFLFFGICSHNHKHINNECVFMCFLQVPSVSACERERWSECAFYVDLQEFQSAERCCGLFLSFATLCLFE